MADVTATLSVQTHQESGGRTVLRPAGEIDLATTESLREVLMAAIARGPVVLDLAEVDFCDSSGLRLLVEAHRRAQRQGTGLRLAAPTTAVRRLFDLTRADRVFPVFPDVPSALADPLPEALT